MTRLAVVRSIAAEFRPKPSEAARLSPEDLSVLQRLWDTREKRFPGSYLVVIQADATILLSTAQPSEVGSYVGDVLLESHQEGEARTVRELIAGKQDWVGETISPAGVLRVSAYSYSSALRGLIAIHVPADEVYAEIRTAALPWALGLTASCLALFLLSLTVLHRHHRRAEMTLQESAERLQAVIQASPAAVAALDSDGLVTLWNAAAERIFGWSNEEVLGHPLPIVPADRQEEGRVLQERVLRGEAFSEMELRRQRRDGSLIDVSLSAAPIRDLSGHIVGVLGMLADISQRTQAEEKLEHLQDQHRLILNAAGEGIYGLDLNGNTTFVNPAAARMIGWEIQELIGKNQHDVLHHSKPDGSPYPHEECPIYGAFRDGVPRFVDQEVFWRKDGTSFPVEYLSTPIRTERGNVVGAVVVFRDISERKQAEETIRRSEANYRMLFDSASDAVLLHDATTGRILDANRKATEMYGYSHEDFMGLEVAALSANEAPYTEGEALERMIAAREEAHLFEWKARNKAGTVFWVEVSLKRVKLNEEGFVLAAVRDISERKQLEAQFRQAQRMEAVGQLAGGVAHDFNNLLGVVIGYSDLLLDGLGADDPKRKRVQEIRKAGERATSLTRQLLAFSRKQVLQLKVLDLNALVDGMDKMLRRLVREDIEFVTVPGAELGRVKADPGQVEQVIMNLVVNARDAMPTGGKLTIETRNVELDEDYVHQHLAGEPGPYVLLAVSDTGHGMDKETQQKIFEPFFSTKGEGKGTGLGLATVYGIVEQSGGYIWVYSELGQGTTFKIYLPRVEEALTVAKPAEIPAGALQGSETIVLVEDAEPVRLLAREFLGRLGYTVLEAGDGVEALAIAKGHKGSIHLLLTDVVMPGLGGPQLAEALLAQHPELKVLYMSGYTDNAIAQHGALESGIFLLEKPFTKETLARKMREVLEAGEEKKP